MIYKVENISFSYAKKKIIDNISIEFKSSKFYGIVGPNGCGKTTFMDLLLRHKKTESGKIILNKKNLLKYRKKEIARYISLVPQDYAINFPFTVKEVVIMGRYPHIPRFSAPDSDDFKIVHYFMEKTETLKFKNRLITQLSGGERQRVVFARALCQNTPIMCLDEATSNLDMHHSIDLLNIAASNVKSKNKTIIAIIQDINLASMFCDNIIFMKNGKIAAHGKTTEVLNEDNIKKVFGVDTKIYFEKYSNSKQVVFKK